MAEYWAITLEFSQMKAIVVDAGAAGHPLRWDEVADPEIDVGEVLVDIHATAVNRADLLQRAGAYPPPPGAPDYMGLEMAGVIAEVGGNVGEWQPGDRVCALLAGGGYAEQVAVPHQLLLRLPDDWDFTDGAAVAEVFLTAFVNLYMEAGLEAGETVLIHGGASGVGTAAIQLARHSNCRVLATTGTATKVQRCLELGADIAIDYKQQDFAQSLAAQVNGVDVILDIGGSEYLEGNLELLNLRGRLVIIALLTGAQATIDLGLLQRKRLRLIGSVLRSRSLEEKTEITRKFRNRFWPSLANGKITPVIDTILPITQAEQAQKILSENRNIGKVVMTVR